MRRFALRGLLITGALMAACIHKRAPHLTPEGGAGGSSSAMPGSGSAAGLGAGQIVDGELVFHWRIEAHLRTARAALSDHDASALHGRLLEITTLGYTSPWQGTCESAGRNRDAVALADVVASQGLGEAGRAALVAFGFGDPLTRFQLACSDDLKAPPLVVWLTDDKLFTCAQGVCYLMRHDVMGAGSGSGSAVNAGSGSIVKP